MAALALPPVRLAAHLSGRRCMDLLEKGEHDWVRGHLLPLGFKRVQVNTTKINGVEVSDYAAAAIRLHNAIREFPEFEWIVQANPESKDLWEYFANMSPPPFNVSLLFDSSCGTGKMAEAYAVPPSNGVNCGYAGGLGPGNICDALCKIRSTVPRNTVFWIDMETGLRSVIDGKDTFDAAKALSICKAVEREGWEDSSTVVTDVPAPPVPSNVAISGHPLLLHKVTLMRDLATPAREFRSLLREVTFHLGYEATAKLPIVRRSDVVTPCGPATGDKAVRIAESVALVPILRAGLGMVDAMLELLPNAVVHHLGMFRAANSDQPIEYYSRLPRDYASDLAFILEPMIATSATVNAAINKLKGWGAGRIIVISALVSRQGLRELQIRHGDVDIFAAQVDEMTSDRGMCVPGMGDVGDRQFGTPAGTPLSQNVNGFDVPRPRTMSGSPQKTTPPPSPFPKPITSVLGGEASYVGSSDIPSPEPEESMVTQLTTHDGAYGPSPARMFWGADTAEQRGPVIATGRHPNQRNAIGAHSGGYSIYRALAVVSRNLDVEYTPKFSMTTPVARIGPFPRWHDKKAIVTIDVYGHAISEGFGPWLEKGYDIRPTIAVTKAHVELPECREALKAGRLQVDGAVLTEAGQSFVTKAAIEPVWYLPGVAERFGVSEQKLRESLFKETNSMYPELLTRNDLKIFLPPIGGLTVYIWGDPEKIPDESVELTVRVHDECNGSDVFGSDICTCRPYLTHAIEECIKTAQKGGTGVVVYFRKEGRALGEVTKYLVYNMRKRQQGGDKASEYFNCTKEVAGVTDTRFQVLMPDVLHWLGITKIHRFISMSDMKHDAVVDAGIQIVERVEIPPELVPKDAQVEITAKVFAGYHSGTSYTGAKDKGTLDAVKGREYSAVTEYNKSVTEGGGAIGDATGNVK
eukprot:TRINITY_DN68757_c0_g1_i1.p1 TRINITY_DN68757_c0_g1~~TRINITY_DN68757_c0_g1_i1.p1  ORF type:complete len:998 (-),score=140.60 TRINITY_DN68757_c0_g1_i1:38-2797(-)